MVDYSGFVHSGVFFLFDSHRLAVAELVDGEIQCVACLENIGCCRIALNEV